MKVIIGSTEGTVKKGMEIDLDSIWDKIRNEFAGNIENWFFDEFMDLHIDMEIINFVTQKKVFTYFRLNLIYSYEKIIDDCYSCVIGCSM